MTAWRPVMVSESVGDESVAKEAGRDGDKGREESFSVGSHT